MLTQRIIRLNDKVRNTDPTIDLDRARLITEFYSRPSMDNYILRRAKAFRYFLENKRILSTRIHRSQAMRETAFRQCHCIRM